MAPVDPSNTPRFKFNYTVNGIGHDFQIRSHSSPGAIGTLVGAFLTALDDAIFGMVIDTVEFAADGSNIFLPVVTGIEGNTYGSGEAPILAAPYFYGFVGRTAAGKRWTLKIFAAGQLGGNYRYSPGELAELDNAVDALQAFGAALVGIDDAQVTVYSYVNAGVNAYWQRELR